MSALLHLCNFRMQGGEVKDYVAKTFLEDEIPEMDLLITTANDPQKMVNFLATKFPKRTKAEIETVVHKAYEAFKSQIPEEKLKAYDTLRQVEVDPSVTVQPYKETRWFGDAYI